MWRGQSRSGGRHLTLGPSGFPSPPRARCPNLRRTLTRYVVPGSRRRGRSGVLGTEMGEGGEGAGGPVAAGDLGDGKQRTPVVAEAVEGGFGHRRIASLDGGEVVLGPARKLAAEFDLNFRMEIVEMSGDFVFFGFDEVNADGAVMQRGRQWTDAGEDGGSKSFEGAHGIAGAFAAVGAPASLVAGIEQAAQFFVLRKKGIDFIQQQNWLLLIHETKEDRRSEAFGAQRPRGHGGEQIEGSGFAAARFRRGEVQARREGKSSKGVRVAVPESQGVGGARGQFDVERETGGDLVQDLCAIDGFGPYKR